MDAIESMKCYESYSLTFAMIGVMSASALNDMSESILGVRLIVAVRGRVMVWVADSAILVSSYITYGSGLGCL